MAWSGSTQGRGSNNRVKKMIKYSIKLTNNIICDKVDRTHGIHSGPFERWLMYFLSILDTSMARKHDNTSNMEINVLQVG